MHCTLALAGALIGVFAATSAVGAQPRVEVGILSCAVSSTTGTIFASSKSLYGQFQRPVHLELYRGRIDRFGLDLGSTGKTAIRRPCRPPPPTRRRARLLARTAASARRRRWVMALAPTP